VEAASLYSKACLMACPQNQFTPFGIGHPSHDSINEYEAAEREWEAAQSAGIHLDKQNYA